MRVFSCVSTFFSLFFSIIRRPPTSILFLYTTLFRSSPRSRCRDREAFHGARQGRRRHSARRRGVARERSEEHTSELQSHSDLVCRLLLEKKKNQSYYRGVLGPC